MRENERRKGIGEQLVNGCVSWFKKEGINRVEIMIATDNPITQGFWKKLGFTSYNEACYKRI